MKSIILVAFAIIFAVFGNCQNPIVRISTELGDIDVEVFIDKAPITGSNFLKYVDAAKYNNSSSFYRVVRQDNQPDSPVKIEVIQGGFFEDSLIEKYQFPPIKHETTKETGILHRNGVISMARLEPGTASSEFFICIGNQPALDFFGKRNSDKQGFAAYGKVVKGMKVVRKIQKQKDKDQYLLKPVKIKNITRI